ncbi:flagellar export protein FliJ [Gilvimarinus chinensis]|uniref:flagellar export protein FliJ n=1 Tax=Gilvimarinus chinensis TaxID=396005 RepID=UPI00037B7A45|nr:flagellar export protein FliJ [Gilvimarinus chinensis]
MTKKRSKRLGVVLMLAERHEQEAADYLAKHQAMVEEQRQKALELVQYRSGYVEQYASSKTGMRPDDLMRYSQFIQQLGEAINQQERAVEQLTEQLLKLRQHWHGQHLRRRAIEDLIVRLRKGEDALAERQLQKQLDDMAQASGRKPL